MPETRVWYQNEQETPLGTVRVVAEQWGTRGLAPGRMRVLGAFALVAVQRGRGIYRDAHLRQEIAAGDVVLVLPDVPHTYVAGRGPGWDELYVVFDGPAFDLLRDRGVLRPDHPVLPSDPAWQARLREFASNPPNDAKGRLSQVAVLMQLLVDLAGDDESASQTDPWLQAAKAALELDLDEGIDWERVASTFAMSAQAFRKRFTRLAGISPARYRAERRVASAANLLRQTSMSHRQIAEALGYVDEFHLSKRFKAAMGITPRAYRAL